jgi:hypothetical protein
MNVHFNRIHPDLGSTLRVRAPFIFGILVLDCGLTRGGKDKKDDGYGDVCYFDIVIDRFGDDRERIHPQQPSSVRYVPGSK